MNAKRALRGCCCLALIGLFCGRALAGPPTVAQSIERSFRATSGSLTLAQQVASGNLLTVQIVQWDANGGHRTASIKDNLGNVYVRAARLVGSAASGANCVEEWYAKNVNGGTVTLKIDYGAGNGTNFNVLLKELSGADTVAPLDQSATFDEGARNLTQHDCAASGGITTAANVYVSGTSALNSAGGTIAPGRGYAQLISSSTQAVYLEQISGASLSGIRGDYATTIPRGACACLVSYKGAGGTAAGSAVAPQIMQSAEHTFGATSGSLKLPQQVAGGNLLTVQIVQWDANGGHRTASIKDNLGNAYVQAARLVGSTASGANCVEEWYAKNVKGGTVTVTASYGTGNSTGFSMLVKEISGADTVAPLDQSATFDEGARNLTQHDCAAIGGITTAASVYVSATSALNSAGGTIAPGRGYTRLISSSSQAVYLGQTSAASLSGTRGDYTTTIPRGACACLVSYKAPAASPPAVQTLYVATNGSDGNPGTLSQPLLTIAAALAQAPTGGAIFLRAGTYVTTGPISLAVSGIQIAAMTGESVTITHGNYAGPIFDISAASVRIQGLILDGQFVSQSCGIVGEAGASLLTISNCELKQFGNHAVALDGADCKLDGCQIHHCLWWDATAGIQPAHGITTLNAQRLTIHNCTIHQVSGDSFFADQGSWQDITIDGCTFYDAPLESGMAGFQQGALVSESGVATQHGTAAPRARLTVRNSSLYGFNSSFVESSTLNLQQQVDAVVDSCDIHDSHIALRLRGLAGDTGAWPTIFNCTVHDSATAIRYEDDLRNLHLAFNTFSNCPTLFLAVPSGSPWGNGWIVQNNLFVGAAAQPQEAPLPANIIPPAGSIDPVTLEPNTAAGLLGSPVPTSTVPLWYPPITKDKAGASRSSTAPTMGAYEFAPVPAANPAFGTAAPPSPVLTVQSGHPRFWGSTSEVSDILAKSATPEGRAIVTAALACAQGGADRSGDRLLCAAFFYRFGSQVGLDAATVASLGNQAVADLLATPVANWGVEADVGWGGAPWAIGYDWLYPLLTAAQKQKLLAAVETALASSARTSSNTVWSGYNQLSGDIPMATALATYNETPTEYVGDIYRNNWFAKNPPWWSYGWQKQAWATSGSREGFSQYFCSCYTNFATRALWESATSGDRSLTMGYFSNVPYWHLFQMLPDTIGGGWPIAMYTSTFSGGNASSRGLWSILQACTRYSDDTGKQLARWLIDQAMGWTGVNRTPGDALLFGLLIGDSRIKGADPATLGIPLTFTMAQPGEVFIRSDWTRQANLAWFGNHTTASRVTPAGEFSLYSRGAYLFGNAGHRIAHSYAPRWLQCGVCFIGSDGLPANANVNVGSVPDYLSRGTFAASSPAGGGASVNAQCALNFTTPAVGAVSRCDRTFGCDAAVKTITLADNIVCDATLTPHIVFPCPTEPVLNADGTVTITNGAASCTLSFSSPPVALLPIGGPTAYCNGLPGTAFESLPYLLPLTVLDFDFAKLAASNSAVDQATLLKQMGLWRLHVVLPAGGGALTTTITVK